MEGPERWWRVAAGGGIEGVVWLCVTVTLYLDGEALGFNKAQLSEQTDFVRRRAGSWTFSAGTVWTRSRGRCRLSADFLRVCGQAARNVSGTHAGCRPVWHPKPSEREVTQEQRGLKQQQKKEKKRENLSAKAEQAHAVIQAEMIKGRSSRGMTWGKFRPGLMRDH